MQSLLVGSKLLEELRASEGLPAYDTRGVQTLRAEIARINADMTQIARDIAQQEDGAPEDEDAAGAESMSNFAGVNVLNASIHRAKRCLLAYAMHRCDRVDLLVWQSGPVVPPSLKARLSSEEADYHKGYAGLLHAYMKAEDADGLMSDYSPPRSDTVSVKALVDCGEVASSKGGSRRIRAGEMSIMPRVDAEPLIRKGWMKEMVREN
jgi:hypothetical protein